MTTEPTPQDALVAHVRSLHDWVEYLDDVCKVTCSDRGQVYIQTLYRDDDVYTGDHERQSAHRWFISLRETPANDVDDLVRLCCAGGEDAGGRK